MDNSVTSTKQARGGEARKKNLTPERRKEIAAAASAARWGKKDKPPEAPPVDQPLTIQEASPAPAPVAEPASRPRIKDKPVPKAYGQALATAEKELGQSLRDLAFHDEMSAKLKAKLPWLIQTIKALGGTINPEAAAAARMPSVEPRGFEMALLDDPNGSISLPRIPIAQGGGLGVIQDGQPMEDENMFLRDEVAGTERWRR